MALLLCIDEPPPLVFLGLYTIYNLCWTPHAIKEERQVVLSRVAGYAGEFYDNPNPHSLEGMSTGMIFCKWAQLNTPRW